MDDLDHSMHIAEYDWTSFYEESEECSLLQASLAGLDNLSLSDSEDSVSRAYPVFQQEAQQGTAENSDISQSNDTGLSKPEETCTGFVKLSVHINQSGTRGQPDDLTIKAGEDGILLKNSVENPLVAQGTSDIGLHYPGQDNLATVVVQKETGAEQITELTNYSTANDVLIAQQTEFTTVQFPDGNHNVSDSTDLEKEDGEGQRNSSAFTQKFIQETDPVTCDQAELNMNMPHTTESDVHEKESSVALSTEKERWFVTVNDSPLRKQVLASPVKKKVRKKKPSRNNHMISNMQEPPPEYISELDINKTSENERDKDTVYFTESDQNSVVHPSSEILSESFRKGLLSESSQMYKTALPFEEKENVSQKMEMSHLPKAITTESLIDYNKCESYSLGISSEKPVNLPTPPLQDTYTLKGENATLLDSVESEELEDSLEMFSTHSCDSESYFSAHESKEEPQHLFKDSLAEKQPVDIKQLSQQRTSSPTIPGSRLFMLTETADVDNVQDTEMHSCDTQEVSSHTISNTAAATSHSSFKEFSQQDHILQKREDYVEPIVTFPSASQRTDLMPQDSCTCDNDTHSTISQMPLDMPELAEHESTALSASSCLVNDHCQSPIPDLKVTPCAVADSPETEALGPTRPVYAMSAFWDEMEKLTIKDILQLRVTRSPSPRESHDTQGSAKPHVDIKDNSTQNSSLVDTVEYVLPDGASADTSDTADSDYFTQLDDSKPDRSSCEFSTFSDFEEEYWQFTGASRNPSPDLNTNSQQSQRTTDFPFLIHDSQLESANPMGKETTVALEQYAGQCFDDHATHIFLSSDACERGMTKSKSMHNVQALNTETPLKDAPLQSMLDDAERLFLSNCQSLDENMVLQGNDSIMLGTITPAPILSNKDILDENYRISFPEVFEYLFTEDGPNNDSRSVTVYDPNDISVAPAYVYPLSKYGSEMSLSSLDDSQCSEGKPIPIFSCSHHAVRDLTFPELDYLFFPQEMYADSEEDDNSSPIRVVSRTHLQANVSSTTKHNNKGWSSSLTSLLSIRKIRFPDKGSIWCRRSGAWVFPVERIPIKRANPVMTMLNKSRVYSFTSQFFNELAGRQRILKSIRTTLSLSKQEGLFYTLKQSDMCLVCIAVASWVLRSSDPKATDAWKAALLANVSAISAIRYLRQYMKKDPQPNEP